MSVSNGDILNRNLERGWIAASGNFEKLIAWVGVDDSVEDDAGYVINIASLASTLGDAFALGTPVCEITEVVVE